MKKGKKESQNIKDSETRRLNTLFEKKKKTAFTLSLIALILISLLLLLVIIRFSIPITGNAGLNYNSQDQEPIGLDSEKVQGNFEDMAQKSQSFAESLPTYINPVWGFFRGIWNIIKPIWEVIFGPTGDEVATTKSMFVIISFLAAWYISDKVPEIKRNIFMHIGITIVAGILFSRWVAQDALIKVVLMPYNAVGAGLSALLPIAVAFYILVIKMNGRGATPVRVLGWILIFVYLAVAWYTAYKDLEVPRQYLIIYPAAIGIMAILAMFSGYIRAALKLAVLADEENFKREMAIQDLMSQKRKLLSNLVEGANKETIKELLKETDDRITELARGMKF